MEGFHFSLVPAPRSEPDEHNFEGTAEELRRFQAYRAIKAGQEKAEADRIEALIDEQTATDVRS